MIDYDKLIKKENIISLSKDLYDIIRAEPSIIDLDLNKPYVFIGDTHGDFNATEKVLSIFSDDYNLVFLGDYVDRSDEELGTLKNLALIMKRKIDHPNCTTLLRGNHEFKGICHESPNRNLLKKDLESKFGNSYMDVANQVHKTFSELSYAVSFENGILCLHGGIPNISSYDEFSEGLEKGGVMNPPTPIVKAIVWNDFAPKGTELNDEGTAPGRGRNVIKFGQKYFDEKMEILGKKVLLRGHQESMKGYNFEDMALTIMTTIDSINCGNIKGRYVASLEDPQKEVNTAKDLKIHFI